MSFYTTLDDNAICREIAKARSYVILASSGVTTAIAESLVDAASRLGFAKVRVILDVSANVARLGFGDHAAVVILNSSGLDVRDHPGLRMGVLICDYHGWAFSMVPRLVEEAPTTGTRAFNAIALTEAQIVALRSELPQIEIGEISAETGAPQVIVGNSSLDSVKLKSVSDALEIAPPQPFSLARRTRIYTALIQFVELKVNGLKIQRKRINIPKTLPISRAQRVEVTHQLRTSFQLFDSDETPIEIAEIEQDIDVLRNKYLIPVGSLGRVIRRSLRAEFAKGLEAQRGRLDNCKSRIAIWAKDAMLERLSGLIDEVAQLVLMRQPKRFEMHGENALEAARQYVRREIAKVLPDSDKLVDGMSIECHFKDVTYEMLSDQKFAARIQSMVSDEDLKRALLVERDAVE